MYEYAPRSKKRREKRLFLVCLAPALLFLILSILPQTPAPVLCRLFAVCAATGAAWIAARYLLRRYTYCVAPCEDGDGSPDLTVTEYYGRRQRVVCRISLGQIEKVSRESVKEERTDEAHMHMFEYTDEIFSPFFCLLTVRDGEEPCRIRILADERLYDILSSCR